MDIRLVNEKYLYGTLSLLIPKHTHTDGGAELPCKVLTRPPGVTWGSSSWPRTFWHTATCRTKDFLSFQSLILGFYLNLTRGAVTCNNTVTVRLAGWNPEAGRITSQELAKCQGFIYKTHNFRSTDTEDQISHKMSQRWRQTERSLHTEVQAAVTAHQNGWSHTESLHRNTKSKQNHIQTSKLCVKKYL